ncbi:deoxyribonuclease IV [Oxyplasma meridianum]|uniref:Probable endonuclease 4 n=1 Tax=Oxyplasma meridianum TaxID=3073602 RepID=A0AAX4NHQ6_9ARCH
MVKRVTDQILLGGHVSTSGGIYKSPERAKVFSFRTYQIFSKNQMQWKAKDLDDGDVDKFRESNIQNSMGKIMVHASYLLNMCTSKPDLKDKVIQAFSIEISRTDKLGIDYLTFHPGSASGITEKEAIANLIDNLNQVIGPDQKCTILMEVSAGQGSTIGSKFEDLAKVMDDITAKNKVAICMDTCHTWAAGYDIKTPEGYAETMDIFKSTLGLEKLKGFHLNDSKKGRGSRVDRHEQIGLGTLGLDGISNFVNDRRFREVPMILETPKGEEGYGQDIENISKIIRIDE